MASDKTMTVKPYDYDVVDDLFPVLFITNNTREDGLTEIPAASLQMVVSALELIRWEVRGADHEIIKETIGIIAGLRDMQKNRERKREDQ
ncbi:MAG: hypothetical protein IIZ78_20735 [Clostridiales bacterium]|nr:hypothetical protein [Clostridiales bacterium]MBQ1779384.1 hypothetical protein [Acidaminococcaceae bacterium]